MEILLLSILLIILQVSFLMVVLIATALMIAGVTSVVLDVPFVKTPQRFFPKIEAALEIKEGDMVYELGSGDGALMIWLGKRHKHATFVGIELNPLLYYYACFVKRLERANNVSFRHGNFYTEDLSGATTLYGYLLPVVLAKISGKISREAPGSRFVSRAFQFKEMAPVACVQLSKIPGWHGEHLLWVYDFPGSIK